MALRVCSWWSMQRLCCLVRLFYNWPLTLAHLDISPWLPAANSITPSMSKTKVQVWSRFKETKKHQWLHTFHPPFCCQAGHPFTPAWLWCIMGYHVMKWKWEMFACLRDTETPSTQRILQSLTHLKGKTDVCSVMLKYSVYAKMTQYYGKGLKTVIKCPYRGCGLGWKKRKNRLVWTS